MFTAGGKVTKAEVRSTASGKEYLAFTVAETKGYGDTKETTWFDCRTWSTSAELMGCKVLVFGQLSQKDVGEKVYNNIEVFHVEIVEGPYQKETAAVAPKKTVQTPAVAARPQAAALPQYKKPINF